MTERNSLKKKKGKKQEASTRRNSTEKVTRIKYPEKGDRNITNKA